MNVELNDILVKEIINTKSLENLDLDYVSSKLEKFILTYGDVYKKLRVFADKNGVTAIKKNKHFKEIVKRVRDELRIVYGSFLNDDFFKKDKYFSKLDFEDEKFYDKLNEVLKCHKSTKERVPYYGEIYKNIFNWYQPKRIGDLACGLNPVSYFYIRLELGVSPKYFASDLSSIDMEFLNSFFSRFKIEGSAKAYDITKMDFLDDVNFMSCDMVFLFKALDSFEEVKKNISKQILEKIYAKKIVVSFPTKSLMSKREFKIEKRNWLFNYLNKMGWSYEQFEVENELFILITKN